MIDLVLATTDLDWLREFKPDTPIHYISVLGSQFWIIAGIIAGRLIRNPDRRRTLELALGWSIAFVQLYAMVWRWMPGNFEITEALPLQLCRIVSWACVVAFIFRARWAISLAFFWGLGLSTMGLITPVITTGLASVEYWLFWLSHAQIVGTAVYFIVVYGWGPTRRDWLFAAAASLAYFAVVVPVNLALGTHYGFLGSGSYPRTTLAGYLGPYPGRIFWILLLGEFWLAFLFLAARAVGRIKRARTPAPATSA
jgi:hypothetical integral membrane protein (TIGR02206 family)